MKVLIINCAINLEGWRGEVYSQGVGSIIALLKQHNYSVEGVALTNDNDIINLYEQVKKEHPDVIGFSSTTNQFKYLKDIVKNLKNISKDSFIVCGGIHPTMIPECIRDIPELDAIVRGEGEFVMLDIADAISSGKDTSSIQNLVFRDGDEVVYNGIRPLIDNIDVLPFPDTDWISDKYDINAVTGINAFMFSRGCAYECTYCSIKALNSFYGSKGKYFRQRSPDLAIKEIELRVEKYRLKYVRFDDNIINANKKWAIEFLEKYKEKIHIPFQCNLRAGHVDSEIAALLVDAGCNCVIIGVEHGNEEFRKKVLNRTMSNAQILESFAHFSGKNICCGVQLLVGLPFETRELFLDTVRLCRKLTLHTHTLSIFSPYPGTELYKICQENNWLPENTFGRERLEAVMDFPEFSKQDIQLCYDVFPYLLHYKHIPLFIPLGWIMRFVKLFALSKD
jgi:radical SAM superfamily enzyme YgiQ (UPF0313 family)